MNARDLLKSPYTVVALLTSAIGTIGYLPLDLWSLLSATSGLWFPIVATVSSTILPEIGYDQLGTQLLIGGALLFVGVQLDKLIDRVQDWRENR